MGACVANKVVRVTVADFQTALLYRHRLRLVAWLPMGNDNPVCETRNCIKFKMIICTKKGVKTSISNLHPVAQTVLGNGRNGLCCSMSQLLHLGPVPEAVPFELAQSFARHDGITPPVLALGSWDVSLVAGHQRFAIDGVSHVLIFVPGHNHSGGIYLFDGWPIYLDTSKF